MLSASYNTDTYSKRIELKKHTGVRHAYKDPIFVRKKGQTQFWKK